MNRGDRVRHARYGKGRVITTSPSGAYVAVKFKHSGSRTVPATEVETC